MSIEKKVSEIEKEFSLMGSDWSEKYELLIEKGKSLPKLGDNYKTKN